MIKELLDIKDIDSIPEMCTRFGKFLGCDKPVPMNVMLRAIDDPPFASDLITCRNTPDFLEALFNDPRNRYYDRLEVVTNKAPQKESEQQTTAKPITNLQLISKAANAFIKWGNAGFSTVDLETLERRENACLACPNLKNPDHLLQKLIPSKKISDKLGERTGTKVCTLCGCNIGRKIRLPTESCPDKHPTLSGMTRWDEPLVTSES